MDRRQFVDTTLATAFGSEDDFVVNFANDATRYQPGHVNYMGYCAAFEGLKFFKEYSVDNVLAHSIRLNKRLLNQSDTDRHQLITPDIERTPIVTFVFDDRDEVLQRLQDARIVVSLSGRRMSVSRAIFNNEDNIDRLATVLDY